jgi:hypothetical protein
MGNKRKYTEVEEKVIKAIGQWDSQDWIISASKDTNGTINFSVHIETNRVDCTAIDIEEIEVRGSWLYLTGKLK